MVFSDQILRSCKFPITIYGHNSCKCDSDSVYDVDEFNRFALLLGAHKRRF